MSLKGIIISSDPETVKDSLRNVAVGLGDTGAAMLQALPENPDFNQYLDFSDLTPLQLLDLIKTPQRELCECNLYIIGGLDYELGEAAVLEFARLAQGQLYLTIAIGTLPVNADPHEQTDLMMSARPLRDCVDSMSVLPVDVAQLGLGLVPMATPRQSAKVNTAKIIAMLQEILVCSGYIGVEANDLKQVLPLPGWIAFGCGEFQAISEIPLAINTALSDTWLARKTWQQQRG